MAASRGCPGPLADALEESEDHVPLPSKRVKIGAASRELVGGSNIDTEEGKRQRKTAAAAVGEGPSSASPAVPTISTPPLPVRYPPFPRPVPGKTAWELRISKLDKKDPRRDLPTVMRPTDPHTARSVLSSRDKAVIRDVARSTVTVIATYEDTTNHFTGIVVGWNETRMCTRIATGSVTIIGDDHPKPKIFIFPFQLHVRLSNKTVLEGEVLFINEHYDIALLEISSESDLPLQVPSFGSNPNYGQEVFVLARDLDSYLMARPGRIEWLEQSDHLGRNCHMFLSCELPLVGTGGPVIDLDGNVTGMVFRNYNLNPRVLAMSTILTCMEMWMKFRAECSNPTYFSRIAHPIHGLRLRTVDLLDVSLQEVLFLDHNINSGYIVDEVSVGSAAERLGIRSGEVIVSFDGLRDHTLPQLEDFLLSLGWRFLQRSTDSSSTVDVKLYVGLPKKTIVEGQLLFFNHHYDIALLEITVNFPLQLPSIGSGPS
ncbi:hypothetical protein BAE44_0008776 [Dichanthelium oligosanthes]|uniref:PDZ domain-containing protein n=1 Tax=Dichanthelium oligosanthes TaxID=888268 RepID=A0A1E5VYN7_9POAL|nr:hypothetical protein BAE44_0008776 [Dichanthelium oligosanthes]